MKKRPISTADYVRDAYADDRFKDSKHSYFMGTLALIPYADKMEELQNFLDPAVPQPSIGDEGWYLVRKVESVDEINKRIDIAREKFPHRKHDLLRHVAPDTKIPEWPGNTRFKLRLG